MLPPQNVGVRALRPGAREQTKRAQRVPSFVITSLSLRAGPDQMKNFSISKGRLAQSPLTMLDALPSLRGDASETGSLISASFYQHGQIIL